jgi:exopolyphosphatase/guanosine-5'-triphosphate,3'-diphosphate pyrophosphatase
MSRYATIDIGTNTALLLIAELHDGQLVTLQDIAEVTGLGRGIAQRGTLHPENAQAALRLLAHYAEQCQIAGVEKLAVIGTASLRDASDGPQFQAEASNILGVPVEIISGDEEARLAALAIAKAFPEEGQRVCFDIGGGSTELILLSGTQILGKHSYPIGSVKLTERFLQGDPPSQDELQQLLVGAHAALQPLPFSGFVWTQPQQLIGTAGTVTTLCAMCHHVAPYDPARIHKALLQKSQLRALFDKMSQMTIAERATLVGLDHRRADVIVAGAAIVLAILETLSAEALTVSDHGLRHGLFWERFAPSHHSTTLGNL